MGPPLAGMGGEPRGPRAGLRVLRPYARPRPVEELCRELGLPGMARLSTNENLFGPAAVAAAREALETVNYYPEHAVTVFTEKLAGWWQVEPGRIALGNGSDELIYLLAAAYLAPGDRAAVAQPPYRVHEMALQFAEASIAYVPLREWRHDVAAMASAAEGAGLVFVTNPHNPSGTLLSADELRPLLDAAPGALVVVDEAYMDFATPDQQWSAISLLPRYPNLVVLRTFSKVYGLAGLRLGFAAAHPRVAEVLNSVRPPYSVNAVALAAAGAALDDEAHRQRVYQAVLEGRATLERACRSLGAEYVPSQANFTLVRLSLDGIGYLMRRGVIVRPGENLGVPGYARITIGTPDQVQALIPLLQAWWPQERR